jgi:trk system potassium uptake protein TrkH
MFLAGVNFALHEGLIRGWVKEHFKNPEFRLYALVTLGAALLITLSRLRAGECLSEGMVRGSLFQTVSIITTTGFITQDYELWNSCAQMLLVILMVIGGCSSSTGGGVKNIRVLVLLRSISAHLKKLLHPRSVVPVKVGGRVVSDEVAANVLAYLALYLLFFVGGALAMLALGLDIPSAIGAVAAALGNVGPGLGSVGAVENYAAVHPVGTWVLSLLMKAGRLEIFPLVVIMRRGFWR